MTVSRAKNSLLVDWASEAQLPNIVFIRSRQGHQTIADAVLPLVEASPLWIEHVAQILVHALSSASALAAGLREALDLCRDSNETWIVALVRGGGSEHAMESFAEILKDPEVRPLLEELAPRLVFAGGHARDAIRYDWLAPKCLAFGSVPLEASTKLVERLASSGLLKRTHDAAQVLDEATSGLPSPSELHRARLAREHERFYLRAKQRYEDSLAAAPILPDMEFIEAIHRGGVLMGFAAYTSSDYRGVLFSCDHQLYQSDSAYSLVEWRQILERCGVEEWEIEKAIEKAE